MPTQASTQHHPHDDAPDTADAFRRLAELPAGRQHDTLRDEIVEAWLPMADRIAGRFSGRGETYEDLRQVAALGLVKAVDRYDPVRGKVFESYAVPTVTGEIKRHFRDHMWTLHVPRRVQELRNRVRSARQELSRSVSDHWPSVPEIAQCANLSEEEVRVGLDALDTFSVLSLDAGMPSGDGSCLGDTLGTADTALDTVVDREGVKPRLQALPERERAILYLRFFEDMTQSQIAEQLGLSQMHVSRLLNKCFRQLREEVLEDAAA
ncbi:RNA polymerase sigma factor SigF [Streptomyces sp. NPDC002514]|uniref:RNA polymerase sigma factor SigF n=1 Tax=Streptomyces sp. NPDC001270 TaxID=3364554 RepID=UPI0036C3EFD0